MMVKIKRPDYDLSVEDDEYQAAEELFSNQATGVKTGAQQTHEVETPAGDQSTDSVEHQAVIDQTRDHSGNHHS